jgi:hypothetical protein
MDFLERSKYINDNHYDFCHSNNMLLTDFNTSSKLKLKCFTETSRNNIKCNKIKQDFKKNKETFLSSNPKEMRDFNYEITFSDFDVITRDVLPDAGREFKKIEFNNYNENNNVIYVNENKIDNMNNIQDFIKMNDAYLKSLDNDKIRTLQYYTYRGDIFLNRYIMTSEFDIIYNMRHAEQIEDADDDAKYHIFYSKELNDYLFKIQMLKYFNGNKDKTKKINNGTLQYSDFKYKDSKTNDYIKILKIYISDLIDIFKSAPKTEKELYLYRGIEINYIYSNIIATDDKIYKNNYFLSTSLFIDKAYKYTKKENRIICRFKIEIGTPIIFVEGISLAKGDMEVIVPKDTFIKLIDDKIYKYLYSKDNTFTKDIICPREYSDYDIIDIIDLNILIK